MTIKIKNLEKMWLRDAISWQEVPSGRIFRSVILKKLLVDGGRLVVMNLKTPYAAVDIIVELIDRPDRPIILIERHFKPLGWAIPGGFMDYGEPAEKTAKREAMEEIGLEVELVDLLGVYSDPDRDERQHTMGLVYIATATGTPKAGDDAKAVKVVNVWEIPKNLCFDHDRILQDYLNHRHYGLRPRLDR